MKTARVNILALVLFEAARAHLGHAVVCPNEVKRLIVSPPENCHELLLAYADMLRQAYSEYEDDGPAPVLPVVDILNQGVLHTTCTGNTTISVRVFDGDYAPILAYEYRGTEGDRKTEVRKLMESSLRPPSACVKSGVPVSAVVDLVWEGIFSAQEVVEEKAFCISSAKAARLRLQEIQEIGLLWRERENASERLVASFSVETDGEDNPQFYKLVQDKRTKLYHLLKFYGTSFDVPFEWVPEADAVTVISRLPNTMDIDKDVVMRGLRDHP